MSRKNFLTAIAIDQGNLSRAQNLAAELKIPLVSIDNTQYQFLLVVTAERLELREIAQPRTKPIYVDFLSAKMLHRSQFGGGFQQLLAKACGVKGNRKPTILDATAGLGVDAFSLASLGCDVTMLERSPLVAALLQDGLRRLFLHKNHKDIKLALVAAQANDYIGKILKGEIAPPDVIYLDPMYPERSKSALNKREMRVLHALVGRDEDADILFKIALDAARRRIVVKRPKLAKCLCNQEPEVIFSGKSCRFDVYLVKE